MAHEGLHEPADKLSAAMTLEWLRRRDAALDRFLRQYLFTEAPITEIEGEAVEAADDDGDAHPPSGSLGIGGAP
jgi:hypothetical protein